MYLAVEETSLCLSQAIVQVQSEGRGTPRVCCLCHNVILLPGTQDTPPVSPLPAIDKTWEDNPSSFPGVWAEAYMLELSDMYMKLTRTASHSAYMHVHSLPLGEEVSLMHLLQWCPYRGSWVLHSNQTTGCSHPILPFWKLALWEQISPWA